MAPAKADKTRRIGCIDTGLRDKMDQHTRTAFTSGSSTDATARESAAWIGVGVVHHPETAAGHNSYDSGDER